MSVQQPLNSPVSAVNKSSSVRKKNSAIPQSSPQGSLKARGIAATITPDEKPKLKEGRKEGLKEEEKEKSGVVVEGDDNNGISDVSGDGKDGEENDGSSNWYPYNSPPTKTAPPNPPPPITTSPAPTTPIRTSTRPPRSRNVQTPPTSPRGQRGLQYTSPSHFSMTQQPYPPYSPRPFSSPLPPASPQYWPYFSPTPFTPPSPTYQPDPLQLEQSFYSSQQSYGGESPMGGSWAGEGYGEVYGSYGSYGSEGYGSPVMEGAAAFGGRLNTYSQNTSNPHKHYPNFSPGLPIQTVPGPAGVMGPEGCNLFIFHIPSDFTNVDLFNLFCPFGGLVSVRIMTEKGTGRGRGFGFVSYAEQEGAELAIRNLNGIALGNKRLKVQFKQSRRRSWSEPGPVPEREAVASRAMEEVLGTYAVKTPDSVSVTSVPPTPQAADTEPHETKSLMGEKIFTPPPSTSNKLAYSSSSSEARRKSDTTSHSGNRSSLTSSSDSLESPSRGVSFSSLSLSVPRSSSAPLPSIDDEPLHSRSSSGGISVESSIDSTAGGDDNDDCVSFKTANQSAC